MAPNTSIKILTRRARLKVGTHPVAYIAEVNPLHGVNPILSSDYNLCFSINGFIFDTLHQDTKLSRAANDSTMVLYPSYLYISKITTGEK